tara:strand:+ start:215 stop:1507 length:1293 start_codon:yes stop_codon:yes gene_type:complete
MTYRSLEGMIRDVISEGLIQEASLGDSKGLMALARRKTGDEKDVMNRAADMMKKGQIKDLNMFMKAMDKSTHKAIMPFIDKKYNKALHEDLEEAVEMCSEECCGLPVTECTCAPDCEHCDCNKINEESDQTDRLSSPLKKDRLDKERQDRDKDGKLKATALPRKKVTEEDEQQDEARGYGEADTHIIMQLRSAQDLGGKKDITFRGGAKAQVDKKHIDKILKLHDHPALKPVQKRQMRVAISKSPKHLASFASKLKEDYDADNVDSILNEAYEEKQDITQQMADKAKKDHMASSDKNKLKKLSDMMKKANEEGFANPAQQAAVMSKLKASGKYKKEEADLDETKGAPKGYHFTRSGQLKKGDANQDGDGGAMLRSDPLDKQRKKIPALPESDDGAPQVSTPRADYKLGKVRMPDGKMVYRKVKKQVDIEK